MSVPAPHFLLHTEATPAAICAASAAGDSSQDAADSSGGGWRFVLKLPSGETSLEVADEEQDATGERLELLALVRGLEALEQPSRVTLVTATDHIQRGLRFGLSQWRENGWQWERFGRMSPVKNRDLWQRVDRLTDIHQLDCRGGRVTTADDLAPAPAARVVHPLGRKLRFDEPEGKHRIASTKSQTDSKSQGLNVQNSRPTAGFGHWSFGHWNLIEIWCLVLGALSRLVPRQNRSQPAAR